MDLKEKIRSIENFPEEGVIFRDITTLLKEGDALREAIDQIQTNDNQTKSGVIDMFMDCLVNDRAPEISGEEALSAMKAVFAAVESAKTGKSVKVS